MNSLRFPQFVAKALQAKGFRTATPLSTRPRFIRSAGLQSTATASLAEIRLGHKVLPPDDQFLPNNSIPLRLVGAMEEKYFQLPLGTRFTVPSRDLGLKMKEGFALALQENGVAVIELGFQDPKSDFMLELVEAMGRVPDTHSHTQGALVSLILALPLSPSLLYFFGFICCSLFLPPPLTGICSGR
jgi:hypothetical protein